MPNFRIQPTQSKKLPRLLRELGIVGIPRAVRLRIDITSGSLGAYLIGDKEDAERATSSNDPQSCEVLANHGL